ncbi:MAG: 2-phospho-L-lactate transferase [Candidatus Binatia bacterium]|nr:2-phospho-L-lactate transferase [Candidatus Binatia bacterium]
MNSTPTLVLAGGVGAARFLRGLHSCTDPKAITVIVNTADDEEFYGFHVSPDIDTVIYTLAGLAPLRRGWGVAADTFHCLSALERFYGPAWFRLGDRDLATHIYRTQRLKQGATLTRVTLEIAQKFGVMERVLPMTDSRVSTLVRTRQHGWLPFQRYLVLHSASADVEAIRLRGIKRATPTKAARTALQQAKRIVLPPSNPLVSLGPILQLRGVRRLLRRKRERILAISPLLGGVPVKGPLDRMLRGIGIEVSPYGVAQLYRDIAATFVLDRQDARYAPRIERLGMRPVLADILITSPERATALAELTLELLPA